MKNLMLFLVLFVVDSQAVSDKDLIQGQWENFKLKYGRIYESEFEEDYRLEVFKNNLHKIYEHNKLYELGLSSFVMAVNHFADLTENEFLTLFTLDVSELGNLTDIAVWGRDMDDLSIDAPPSDLDENDLVDEVDWRREGYVTPVKNQERCASSWTFSATGALEGQWYKKMNQLISLSEQNLVDCLSSEGNNGCRGEWMPLAFKYIIKNKGIDTESSYPYEGKVNKCRFNSKTIGATATKWVNIPPGENELKSSVAIVGPIAVAMEVIGSFQLYSRGVYDDPKCGSRINHAMLAIGYGSQNGKDYWLVKNSWGSVWGEAGYVKMVRNKNNQCAIASTASYPIV